MAKTIRLTEHDLSVIIKRVIKEGNEEDILNVKRKLVDTGKISEEVFDEIVFASNEKGSYVRFLALAIDKGFIRNSDIEKWGPEPDKYFGIFEKAKKTPTGKSLFPIVDIGQIKSKADVEDLIKGVVKFKNKDVVSTNLSPEGRYVSPSDIIKLENVGVDLIGTESGYQIFKTSNKSKETWQAYKTILGKCKDGASIEICTIGGYQHYLEYLTDYPGSAYYIIFNQNDPDSPYQFHYETNQFKQRDDSNMF